jgi:hypothetical protein
MLSVPSELLNLPHPVAIDPNLPVVAFTSRGFMPD